MMFKICVKIILTTNGKTVLLQKCKKYIATNKSQLYNMIKKECLKLACSPEGTQKKSI